MAKKVIIFDDDDDLLEVCSLILEARNFEVIVKNRCSTILDDIHFHQPDLILMDNWIPDIGGVKATHLIKSNAAFAHIPVIFFSANNNVGALAAEAGAEYSLQKPFNITDLEDLVISAVGKA
jgi:DNA-binding response OmpR family regulator